MPLPVPGLNGKLKPEGVTWDDKEWSEHFHNQVHLIPVDELDKWLEHYNLGAATRDSRILSDLKCKNRRKLLRQFVGQTF
ncbi:hypothetical protein I317_00332 [Kwoniella heveanensis CBS 569]|uniref:Uncharacterized protein n=1 Tax=Kwoniella heveanensis BCC8398 TaxID=1296120 RepID=A0A1B9GN76_9TREE|nr:hypothetical protein I316_05744 [Kwoniella heveanensis BCC8398]OCF45844.1 hypothetical protein I317_00332 [Kwoniella heveanensis CBS 569]